MEGSQSRRPKPMVAAAPRASVTNVQAALGEPPCGGCLRPSAWPIVVTISEQSMEDVVATQVAVRDLKTHLSQWLARAQAGEVVVITSHRRPIAQLTGYPPATEGAPSPLQQAMAAGVVSWNGRKPHFPPPVKLSGEGPSLSDLVLEGRN